MKVYWGSSVGRSYDPEHVRCIVEWVRATPHDIIWNPATSDALIERSRARSATTFLLETDAEVWVSVDSDIVFERTDLDLLAEQAVTHDIVVGAYTTRSQDRPFITSFLERDVPVAFAADPTPVPIKWGATGFMAVHRRVFEKLSQDLPLYHPTDPTRHYPFFLPFGYESGGVPIMLSEDWAFSEYANRAGFTCHINPAIRLGHIGSYCYRLEDLTSPPPMEARPLQLTRTTDGSPSDYRVVAANKPVVAVAAAATPALEGAAA